jgi:hypothetical protein
MKSWILKWTLPTVYDPPFFYSFLKNHVMNSIQINTTIKDKTVVTVSAESELMNNYQAALPVSADSHIAAVHDAAGNPMVFSFSEDGDLYVIHHADDHPTGWNQVDISTDLKNFGKAKSFSVSQLPGGNIFLSVAIQDAADAATENLYIAGPLSPDLTITDWSKISNLWKYAGNPHKGTAIDKIYVSPVDNGNGFGIPNMAVSLNDANLNDINEYILSCTLEASTGEINWHWTDFPTPTDKVAILDYALGSISDLGQGVYILYQGTGNQYFLIFKTFLNEYGRSYDRLLSLPAGANTLQAVPGADGTTCLFVAGSQGVHFFDHSNQAKNAIAAQIAGPGDIPAITHHGLIVRQDQVQQNTISVWALSNGSLYYFRNNYNNDPAAWSSPVLFAGGVSQVAPLINNRNYANELVYIGTDLDASSNLYYMWQDPATTLWKKDHIPLYDTGHVLEFCCYTTHVSVTDEDDIMIPDLALKLTSESWVRVIVNGINYVIGPDTPAAVTTDSTGTLTIITKVTDIVAHQLHITSDYFTGTIDLNPDSNVYNKLRLVKQDSDIPVLPDPRSVGVQPGEVSAAIKGMMQFYPAASNSPAQVISYRPLGIAPQNFSPASLPDNSTVGVSFTGSTLQLHSQTTAAAFFKAGVSVNTLKGLPGDLLRWLENKAEQIEHFAVQVVNGITTFFVKIGKEIVQFVITTYEQLSKAINCFFKKLKLKIEDLIRWLGKKMGWDQIWKTHKVIAAMMIAWTDFAIEEANEKLEDWRKAAAHFFDDLDSKVRNLILPDEIANTNPKAHSAEIRKSLPSINMNHPLANWTSYQMKHGGILQSVEKVFANDPLVQFMNDVVVPAFSVVSADTQRNIQDLMKVFTSTNSRYKELLTLVADLADTAIDATKTVVDGLFKFMMDLLKDLKDLLEGPIDIPFLSSFYKWITGVLGEKEQLTAINGAALLVAIPVTYLYEAVHGKALFADTTYGMDNPEAIKKVLKNAYGPAPVKMPAPLKTSLLADKPNDYLVAQHYISAIGGMIGSVASIISGVLGLGRAIDKFKYSRKINNRIVLGLDVIKMLGTFPLPGKSTSAGKGIRIGYYILMTGMTLIKDIYNVKKNPEDGPVTKAQYLIMGGSRILGLVCYIIANGLDKANPIEWGLDFSTNISGAVYNFSRPFKDDPDPLTKGIALTLMATGGVYSIGSSVAAIAYSITKMSEVDEVIHLVNLGFE